MDTKSGIEIGELTARTPGLNGGSTCIAGAGLAAASMPEEPAAEPLKRDLDQAVKSLSRWPGVRRVWLFGSAAKGGPLDWRSDLDFAVEGMAKKDYGKAWAELDEALPRPVDLVLWETAPPVLRQQITLHGKLLHEA